MSVIEGDAQDGTALKVDATFENQTRFLGPAGGGTGITVYRVEIDYAMADRDPPSFAYPVCLYAPPASGNDAAGGGTVVLSDIPIVPVSLKQWLIDNDAAGSDGVVEMTAEVTFLARTDLGDKLAVEGALAVTLSDAGDGGGGPTEATVTIEDTLDGVDGGSGTDGQFRVYRTGDSA